MKQIASPPPEEASWPPAKPAEGQMQCPADLTGRFRQGHFHSAKLFPLSLFHIYSADPDQPAQFHRDHLALGALHFLVAFD